MNSLDFFFSSRRRHTRWPRDWSSDVCSSDLPAAAEHATRASPHPGASILLLREVLDERAHQGPEPEALRGQHLQARSEERRVGKEGRSRWEPDDDTDKHKRHELVRVIRSDVA